MSAAAIMLSASLLQGPLDDARRDVGLVVPPLVEVDTIDGRNWYTVRAENASAETTLARLAKLSGRHLEGFEALEHPALLTVDLVRRPLSQVLEFALGSIDLRHELRRDAITVLPDEASEESAEARLNVASAAWLRAATRFPDHPAAASARLAQGEIAELRGMPGAARDHYVTLAEDYPRSSLAAEAIMRAGRLAARMGQWGEAAQMFRELVNLDLAPEYHASARLEWARAMVAQGDPDAALQMLSALDANYPAEDTTAKTARRLVRARALNARGRYAEALREIDRTDRDFDGLGAREALQIRAVALEGIGLPGEAARSWLVFAEDAIDPEKVMAFEQAARLSLADGDELAALFVVRQAEQVGVVGLERFERDARQRLGFDVEEAAPSVGEQVAEAEGWLDDEELERAGTAFQALFLARGTLDDETAARVCVGWARCVESARGLEAAIGILAEERSSFDSLEERRRIDVGAAGLFEKNGRFDEAIEAYRGRYARP